MSGFKFRLERVLRLRETLKQERARELGEVREEMNRSEATLAALKASRNCDSGASGERGLTAGDLTSIQHLSDLIDQHIEAEEAIRVEVETRLQEALANLAKAHGEERAMEILRERAHERWSIEEVRREQKELDEAARRRGIRASSDHSDSN